MSTRAEHVRARMKARKEAGADQTYPQHAGRARPGSAPARVALPVLRAACPFQGEFLKECSTCAGPNEARRTYYCDHPENDDGRCTRGNTQSGLWTCSTCHHHPDATAPARPGDPRVGVVIGAYKFVEVVDLSIRALRAKCGPVPVLVVNDHPESAAKIAAVAVAHEGVRAVTNPARLGHTAGDVSAFWRGLNWASNTRLDYLVKLSQRMIPTGAYWAQEWAKDLRASGYFTATRAHTDPRYPIRTECVVMDVGRWSQPDIVSDALVDPEIWHRKEGGYPAEMIVRDLVREKLGGAYWPIQDLAPDRAKSGPYLWHNSNTRADYDELARHLGVTLPPEFTVAGWEQEHAAGLYQY